MRPRPVRHRLLIVAVALTAAVCFPLGAIAGHQFADVPNTNQYHADIGAIAAAGVTTGCGGGNFCPDDLVTREQMAAFMNRLGALGAGKTPVVNAKTALDIPDLEFETLALVNGWVVYSAQTHTPAAALDAMGVVHLRGALTQTSGSVQTPFLLPAKFRPSKVVYVPINLINGKPGRLNIDPSGQVFVQSANLYAEAQNFTSLEGVTYSVVP